MIRRAASHSDGHYSIIRPVTRAMHYIQLYFKGNEQLESVIANLISLLQMSDVTKDRVRGQGSWVETQILLWLRKILSMLCVTSIREYDEIIEK
jgi:hypothetical protein